MDVVGEQPGCGCHHPGAEVADGQLPELTHQDGESERREIHLEQGDPIALEHVADGVQPPLVGGRDVGRIDGDDIAVLVEQHLHVHQCLVQRLVTGRLQERRGRRLLVGGR